MGKLTCTAPPTNPPRQGTWYRHCMEVQCSYIPVKASITAQFFLTNEVGVQHSANAVVDRSMLGSWQAFCAARSKAQGQVNMPAR